MENKQKNLIKLKFGLCLKRLINDQKSKSGSPKKSNKHKLIPSLRKLAAASGMEYAIIQRISTGKKNPELTTIVAIAEAFELELNEFFVHFDRITEDDLKTELAVRTVNKKRKSKNRGDDKSNVL